MNYAVLLTQWKDSLKLFHRATFSLYMLGCLNTIKLAVPYMFTYFWWAFIGLIVLHIGHAPKIDGAIPNLGTNITVLLHIILLFAYISCMRPSIEQKNGSYFASYFPRCMWAVALTYLLVGPYLLPLAALVLLFFFDTNQSLNDYGHSWRRACKAMFYLLPATIILAIGKVILNVVWYKLAHGLDAYIPGIQIPLLAIIHLLNYASLTVFYIRMKHNYFHLIFE
ncbi:hypothetical protein FJ365_04250 [Candidatus Dependentiae bacterium]|nr:hypothetical protein [Candidatus Dependentiae bacterium]